MATLDEDEIDVIDDEHLNALLSFPPDVQQAIEQVNITFPYNIKPLLGKKGLNLSMKHINFGRLIRSLTNSTAMTLTDSKDNVIVLIFRFIVAHQIFT